MLLDASAIVLTPSSVRVIVVVCAALEPAVKLSVEGPVIVPPPVKVSVAVPLTAIGPFGVIVTVAVVELVVPVAGEMLIVSTVAVADVTDTVTGLPALVMAGEMVKLTVRPAPAVAQVVAPVASVWPMPMMLVATPVPPLLRSQVMVYGWSAASFNITVSTCATLAVADVLPVSVARLGTDTVTGNAPSPQTTGDRVPKMMTLFGT